MGESWRATIDKSANGKHWLVYFDNYVVPSAFETFSEAVQHISEHFGLSGVGTDMKVPALKVE